MPNSEIKSFIEMHFKSLGCKIDGLGDQITSNTSDIEEIKDTLSLEGWDKNKINLKVIIWGVVLSFIISSALTLSAIFAGGIINLN